MPQADTTPWYWAFMVIQGAAKAYLETPKVVKKTCLGIRAEHLLNLTGTHTEQQLKVEIAPNYSKWVNERKDENRNGRWAIPSPRRKS